MSSGWRKWINSIILLIKFSDFLDEDLLAPEPCGYKHQTDQSDHFLWFSVFWVTVGFTSAMTEREGLNRKSILGTLLKNTS